jgi:hypothetical protein
MLKMDLAEARELVRRHAAGDKAAAVLARLFRVGEPCFSCDGPIGAEHGLVVVPDPRGIAGSAVVCSGGVSNAPGRLTATRAPSRWPELTKRPDLTNKRTQPERAQLGYSKETMGYGFPAVCGVVAWGLSVADTQRA